MNWKLSRRQFLSWTGLAGLGAAVPRAVRGLVTTPKEELPGLEDEVHAPAICKTCSGGCMMQVRMVKGEAVGLWGMAGHPVSQGTLCAKGFSSLQEMYHPDRLRAPHRRASRATGRWRPISWDEAFALLDEKLAPLAARGAARRFGMVTRAVPDVRHALERRLARAVGTPNAWEWHWTPSQMPIEALRTVHGTADRLVYDLERAQMVASFGWDWLQQFSPSVKAQRMYGAMRQASTTHRARIVQFEPRLSITATKADAWHAVKPGTEGVAALGIAHALLVEGLYDKAFVARWTEGFEAARQRILVDFGPGDAADICGVKPEVFANTARELASVRHPLAITNRRDPDTQEAVHLLNLLLGSVGRAGGVVAQGGSARPLTPGPELAEPGGRPLASLEDLPAAIVKAKRSPLDVLWLEGVNPAFTGPDPRGWEAALGRVPFVVSVAAFLDETASLGDLVLPPHGALEALQDGYSEPEAGSSVVSIAPAARAPLRDTRDLGDIVIRAARGLGGRVAAAFPWESGEQAVSAAAVDRDLAELLLEGGWKKFESRSGGIRACVARPGGKLRFPPDLKAPIAPARGGHELTLHVHYPQVVSYGEGAHLPYLQSLLGPHLLEQWGTWVEIHPDTARELNVADQQEVWVESKAGAIKAKARHFKGVARDVVSIPFGLGHTAMGRWAEGVGSNPARLLSSPGSWSLGEPVNVRSA